MTTPETSRKTPASSDEQLACNHEWEFSDDSFDHEFGTELIHYWRCEKCGSTKPTTAADYGNPEP